VKTVKVTFLSRGADDVAAVFETFAVERRI
jgi:hypothetical protein